MRKSVVYLLMAITLLAFGAATIPTHELGHVVAVEAAGGTVSEVVWISFSPIPSGDGETSLAGRMRHITPSGHEWIISAAGGFFQGVIYFILGTAIFIAARRMKLQNRSITLEIFFTAFYTSGWLLGAMGIAMGVAEGAGMW